MQPTEVLSMAERTRYGGVIHTYQKYDPLEFPSPTQPPPDLVSPAFEHWLAYGRMRRLSEKELARAIRLDPRQIAGLGPSLDALIEMLRERKRKILEKYETESVLDQAGRRYQEMRKHLQPPRGLRERFEQATRDEQLYELERLWYILHDDQSPFSRGLVQLMERLGDKYQVEQLAAKYTFTGREPLTVEQALEVKKELETIDKLLEQLEEALKTAQIAVIDLDALSEFA